jgi:hypothetical protein
MGLSASQAAGVCGNLSFESHFSTDNLQDDISRIDHDPNYKYNSSDRKGYGLMQWSEKIEKTKLLQTANNMNLNVSDLNAQLAHFQEERHLEFIVINGQNLNKKLLPKMYVIISNLP